jgi:uncharacterized protein (DUF58 family)
VDTLAGKDPSAAEIARAARILALRTRREASGSFAGSYVSAFRGGGLEFDESRPYVPGDDVRTIDWNALARTGEPFVKRYREERDQLLLLALDVSASMRFGALGGSKAQSAAHTTALLAAAAGRAGDRVGLVCFDARVREQIAAARGPSHTWRLIRSAAQRAEGASGETKLASAIEALLESTRQRAVVILLSDFRDPELAAAVGDATSTAARALRSSLVATSRRHELLSIVFSDPREAALPRVGLVRMSDPERPGSSVLVDSGSARVRERHAKAWALRRRSLERGLRAVGSDVLWLRTDRDPLRSLMIYFAKRASGARGGR